MLQKFAPILRHLIAQFRAVCAMDLPAGNIRWLIHPLVLSPPDSQWAAIQVGLFTLYSFTSRLPGDEDNKKRTWRHFALLQLAPFRSHK